MSNVVVVRKNRERIDPVRDFVVIHNHHYNPLTILISTHSFSLKPWSVTLFVRDRYFWNKVQ